MWCNCQIKSKTTKAGNSLSPENPLNHRLLPDHPTDKLADRQLFLLDLLFAGPGFQAQLLQCGLRPPDLFGWCTGLFLFGDAVVPEHILPVVGLLVVLALGSSIELVLGGLSAGFTEAVAAQGAAGIRAEEDTSALTASMHDPPGVQDTLSVVTDVFTAFGSDSRSRIPS